MSLISRRVAFGVLMFVASTGVAAPAAAIPIIDVFPATQNVTVGDSVSVDINVSGLPAPVGTLMMVVSFDESILNGVGYTIGDALGVGIDLSFGFASGIGSPLDLFYISFEDTLPLALMQGSGFRLASLDFVAIGDGVASVAIDSVSLLNAAGVPIHSQLIGARVCVGSECSSPDPDVTAVPEPATLSMLGTALAGLFAARRRNERVR